MGDLILASVALENARCGEYPHSGPLAQRDPEAFTALGVQDRLQGRPAMADLRHVPAEGLVDPMVYGETDSGASLAPQPKDQPL